MTGEWINKVWCIHTMESYSRIKKEQTFDICNSTEEFKKYLDAKRRSAQKNKLCGARQWKPDRANLVFTEGERPVVASSWGARCWLQRSAGTLWGDRNIPVLNHNMILWADTCKNSLNIINHCIKFKIINSLQHLNNFLKNCIIFSSWKIYCIFINYYSDL